jgi:hypothetical protein
MTGRSLRPLDCTMRMIICVPSLSPARSRTISSARSPRAGRRKTSRPRRRASRASVGGRAKICSASPAAETTPKAGNVRPTETRAEGSDPPPAPTAVSVTTPSAIAITAPPAVAVTTPPPRPAVKGAAVVPRRVAVVAIGARCVARVPIASRRCVAGAPSPKPIARRSGRTFNGKERCSHRQGDDKCP